VSWSIEKCQGTFYVLKILVHLKLNISCEMRDQRTGEECEISRNNSTIQHKKLNLSFKRQK